MGEKLKVAIVGLPSFASKLAKSLTEFFPDGNFKSFDTYYNKADKLKIIPFLLTADVLYSINGTIGNSKVFDLALKLKKKVVFHWVGTDVLTAIDNYKNNKYKQKYIDYPDHLCEVEWIQEELKTIHINAKIQNFVAFNIKNKNQTIPKNFYVLSYLFPGREDFYGYQLIKETAKQLPHIQFKIAGTTGENLEKLANIEFLGWVKNLPVIMAESAACIRIPEHDGLSNFILESLSLSRPVIYKYQYPNCLQVNNAEQLTFHISKLYNSWEGGHFPVNLEGSKFIDKNFNAKAIFSSLINTLKQ